MKTPRQARNTFRQGVRKPLGKEVPLQPSTAGAPMRNWSALPTEEKKLLKCFDGPHEKGGTHFGAPQHASWCTRQLLKHKQDRVSWTEGDPITLSLVCGSGSELLSQSATDDTAEEKKKTIITLMNRLFTNNWWTGHMLRFLQWIRTETILCSYRVQL
jgi:hypothetical protein